jgi:hypothetical protein
VTHGHRCTHNACTSVALVDKAEDPKSAPANVQRRHARTRSTTATKHRQPECCEVTHQPQGDGVALQDATAKRSNNVVCDGRCTQPPHTTKHTTKTTHAQLPRHTHSRAVRPPSVEGMLPESWLLSSLISLQDTRTAIASHCGTRCHCRAHHTTQLVTQHQ